jgi:hypothetical protein
MKNVSPVVERIRAALARLAVDGVARGGASSEADGIDLFADARRRVEARRQRAEPDELSFEHQHGHVPRAALGAARGGHDGLRLDVAPREVVATELDPHRARVDVGVEELATRAALHDAVVGRQDEVLVDGRAGARHVREHDAHDGVLVVRERERRRGAYRGPIFGRGADLGRFGVSATRRGGGETGRDDEREHASKLARRFGGGQRPSFVHAVLEGRPAWGTRERDRAYARAPSRGRSPRDEL